MCEEFQSRNSGQEKIIRMHVLEERHGAVHILRCFVYQQNKHYIVFYYIKFVQKKINYGYDVYFGNGSLTGIAMQKLVVFRVLHNVRVQNFVMYLSTMVHRFNTCNLDILAGTIS